MENKELVENCRIWYEEGFNDCKKEKDKKFKEFIRLLKEVHQKLSDKHGSWAEYDKEFKKEIDKLSGLKEEELK